MKYQSLVQAGTIAYSASNPVQLNIGSKPYWITGVLLDLELAKTDAASPAPNQDWLWRSITQLSIIGDGGKNYASYSGLDLRMAYWQQRLRYAGRLKAMDETAGSHTYYAPLFLGFGVNPLRTDGQIERFDRTAAIKPTPDLTITVTWAANSVIGANMTVGTGTIVRVSLCGIIPENPAEMPTVYPVWNSTVLAPTQTYAGLGYQYQLPTGYKTRRLSLGFINGASPADVRNDGLSAACVSELSLTNYAGEQTYYDKVWNFTKWSQADFLVADDNSGSPGATAAYGVSSPLTAFNPGVGLLDLLRFLDLTQKGAVNPPDPVYGLNGTGKNPGFANLNLTVDTSSNTKIWVVAENYLPYGAAA